MSVEVARTRRMRCVEVAREALSADDTGVDGGSRAIATHLREGGRNIRMIRTCRRQASAVTTMIGTRVMSAMRGRVRSSLDARSEPAEGGPCGPHNAAALSGSSRGIAWTSPNYADRPQRENGKPRGRNP